MTIRIDQRYKVIGYGNRVFVVIGDAMTGWEPALLQSADFDRITIRADERSGVLVRLYTNDEYETEFGWR